MQNFFAGMHYFLLGLQNLNTKGLKRFVIMPILFNLLVFCAIAYFGYHYIHPWVNYYIDKLPHWLGFLSTVFTIFFFLLFILIFLSTFSVLANLFAAPFNGFLAEHVQKILKNEPLPERGITEMLWQTIRRQGQFIAYYLPRLLLMCLLFLIPVIHPFLPFAWFLFNAWILAIQYQDFAMDNNLVNFYQMRDMINKNKGLSIGFGLSANIVSFIPFLNILVMPAAVIGGTLMFFDPNYSKIRQISKNRI